MEIYLIRHTKVKIAEGVCYGQSDVELSDFFEIELKILKGKLSLPPKTIFYSSPMKRCVLLSKKLSSIPPIIDDRLNELKFADWELKEWNSINEKEFKKWANDFVNNQIPGGESYLDLYNRTTYFFKELLEKDHKTSAIITHSGNIRSILSYVLQIPLKNSFVIHINFGSITKLIFNRNNNDSQFILEYINN